MREQIFASRLALLVALVCAMIGGLMYLGLRAARRQQRAVSDLSASQRVLAAERLIAELERATRLGGEGCLRDLMRTQIWPDKLGNEISQWCGIARAFYVVEDCRVVHPQPGDPQGSRIAEALRWLAPVAPYQMYELAFTDDPPAQIFYSSPDGGDRFLVLDLDLEFIRTYRFPHSQRITNLKGTLIDAPLDVTAPGLRFFPSLFPFWGVQAASVALPLFGEADVMGFGAVMGLLGAVTMMLAVLLVKDTWAAWTVSSLRERLVSGVTHELRTPLAGIRFYAEMLVDPEPYTQMELRDFADRIVRQCDELTSRVERFLGVVRLSHGERTYVLEPHGLAGAAERVLHLHRSRFDRLGFNIDVLVEARPAVRLDTEAFSDAFLNLLDNAVKYSGESRRIEVRICVSDREGILAVRDFGVGIPRDQTERIFQRFYRFAAGGKAGFGLGLYVVSHIMNGHNGRVEVTSALGKGSEFRLVFPLCSES